MLRLMKDNEQSVIIMMQCKKWYNTVRGRIQEKAANSTGVGGAKKGVKKTVAKLEIYHQGFED